MRVSLSLFLLGLTLMTTVVPPALAQGRGEAKRERKQERRVERQIVKQQVKQNVQQNRAFNQAVRQANQNRWRPDSVDRGRNDTRAENRWERRNAVNTSNRWQPDWRDGGRNDSRAENRWERRTTPPATSNRFQPDWRDGGRGDTRAENQWERRQIASRVTGAQWNAQRDYLRKNIRRLNRLNQLNALQQQQLDAQMRQAWLSYNNNVWTGPYNYDYYSDPQFLDYLNTSQPSLLNTILGYLGFGGAGYVTSDWGDERQQLAANMYRIHQLALAGRISRAQEAQLMAQLRAEFLAFHNNSYSGPYGLTQYSDPQFLDYLYNRRPSVLTTIRSYLGY